jgi:hypothetical protein
MMKSANAQTGIDFAVVWVEEIAYFSLEYWVVEISPLVGVWLRTRWKRQSPAILFQHELFLQAVVA